MSTFTKEQLIARADHLLCVGKAFIADHPGYDGMAKDVELFKIALASLEAEPVAWRVAFTLDGQSGSDFEKTFESQAKMNEVISLHERAGFSASITPLYTAPPAPVFDRQAICDKVHGKCSRIPGATFYNAAEFAIDEMEACLAAMLQGAEPVMTAYKLPFEQWLSQQGERIEIDCGCVSVEVFMHWLRMAYGAGNSPVIPDGWVDCSERMPEENSEQEVLACFKGGDISTLYYFEGRWDDAYGIVPIRQDVTHWMPLPAAPQQEVKP
ncbi:DUF551 domain-containing protein [Escherichia coli]|nr:DUF551 domain-containing protein [Escherichia coli]